ncbi:efflux RND transporter periplasmic adaptor subunit [Pontibacter sp. 13R65]|uniref:efflux RND transporter periplasmic adaptor subunit n=1 Tax=Pontibacter sp. 13R65 TaxID=3127458 RepID=UPI00301D96D4
MRFSKASISKLYSIMLLAGMSIMGGCGAEGAPETQQQSNRELPTLQLEQVAVTMDTEYPARIEGKVNVDIRPQAEGYLQQIFVEEGASVKAGQPLFKIEDAPYVEQLHTAQAGLEAAKATLSSASLEVEKFTGLSERKVTSEFQLKAARAAYESARAHVSQMEAAVKTAKINLGFTLVKAPVSGVIGRIPKRMGNLVTRSDAQPLTTLSDISQVYAYFSITERDFLKFAESHAGSSMDKLLSSLPEVSLVLANGKRYEAPGKIQMVDGQFDTATGAISLRAMFPNPGQLLRSGNTGKIVLPEIRQEVLLVPVTATLDIQDKIFALRLKKDNSTERVALSIAGTKGDDYVVTGGLAPGDRIVTQQVATVQEGEQIKPLTRAQ